MKISPKFITNNSRKTEPEAGGAFVPRGVPLARRGGIDSTRHGGGGRSSAGGAAGPPLCGAIRAWQLAVRLQRGGGDRVPRRLPHHRARGPPGGALRPCRVRICSARERRASRVRLLPPERGRASGCVPLRARGRRSPRALTALPRWPARPQATALTPSRARRAARERRLPFSAEVPLPCRLCKGHPVQRCRCCKRRF
jgi:hypothetical protein